MQTLQIDNSSIYVGETYLNLANYLPQGRQVIIITDTNVYRYYKDFIDKYQSIVIPTGEKAKVWKTVNFIVEELLVKNADRNTFLIGFGGGVVTDITGFVASIFMRGVSFGFVASSLLAQVDASLGGKNGINFQHYKNVIGVFNTPEFVICDTALLKTLPEREIRSGFGEIIKHSLIKDALLFEYLKENSNFLLSLNKQELEYVIWKAINIKAEVVERDFTEKGERKQLNFGHTIGHAVENNSSFTHGEAVAVGMFWAAKWSAEKGFINADELQKIKAVLELYHLPTTYQVEHSLLSSFIQKDKKKQGSAIDFVFLKEIGKAQVISVAMKELFKALER